jgi:hypothetical protein
MTVANVGRRPIVWQGWGGKYKKRRNGSHFAIFDKSVKNHLPKRLEEGDSHTACVDLEGGFLDNVKSFFMWDASGKKWKLSRKQVTKLMEEAKEPAT